MSQGNVGSCSYGAGVLGWGVEIVVDGTEKAWSPAMEISWPLRR